MANLGSMPPGLFARSRRVPVLVASLALATLAACGGGGEQGSGSVPGELNLVLTESNAKAAMQNALAAASSPVVTSAATIGFAASFASALTQAKSRPAPGAAAPGLIFEAALALAARARSGPSGGTKAAVEASTACAGGGSLQISAQLASASLSAGDRLVVVASDCRLPQETGETVVSGQISLEVTSGTMGGPLPRKAQIAFALSGFRLLYDTRELTSSGELLASYASEAQDQQSTLFTGRSLSMTVSEALRKRDITWKDFEYTLLRSGTQQTAKLQAIIDTEDAALGSGIHTYAITAAKADEGAQDIRVQGVRSGLSLANVAAGVALGLDADGDGRFETIVDTAADADALFAPEGSAPAAR